MAQAALASPTAGASQRRPSDCLRGFVAARLPSAPAGRYHCADGTRHTPRAPHPGRTRRRPRGGHHAHGAGRGHEHPPRQPGRPARAAGHLLARVLRARPGLPVRRLGDLRAAPLPLRPDRRRAARPARRPAAGDLRGRRRRRGHRARAARGRDPHQRVRARRGSSAPRMVPMPRGLRRTDHGVGEDDVGQADAEVRDERPARAAAGGPATDGLADRRHRSSG